MSTLSSTSGSLPRTNASRAGYMPVRKGDANDRYGNMTCVVNGQTQGLCPSYTFGSTTNQIINSNYTYDSSGDLTQNGTGTL